MLTQIEEAFRALLPRNSRLSRRVGVEHLAFFLLLKWLDQQEPGIFLAPFDDEFRWSNWIHRADVQMADGLCDFVGGLLMHLKDLARRDPAKPLAALFGQPDLLIGTFTETAPESLRYVDELDLSQPAVRKACARALLRELDSEVVAEGVGGPAVPEAVCQLAVKWAEFPKDAVVFDPSCATGAFLARVVDQLRVAGHIRVRAHADLTSDWVMLCNAVGILETGKPFAWRTPDWVDTRRSPVFPADLVLTNPPFGNVGKDRWEPLRWRQDFTRLEDFFLARALSALEPNGGRLAIILPQGFLSRRDPRAVGLRRRLLDEFRLLCVVSLPSRLFRGTAVKTSLLLVERTDVKTDQILYCEMPLATANDASASENWNQAVAELCRTVRAGVVPGTVTGDVIYWTVPADMCRVQHYDLTPRNPDSNNDRANLDPPAAILERLLDSALKLEQSLRNLQGLVTKERGEAL